MPQKLVDQRTHDILARIRRANKVSELPTSLRAQRVVETLKGFENHPIEPRAEDAQTIAAALLRKAEDMHDSREMGMERQGWLRIKSCLEEYLNASKGLGL